MTENAGGVYHHQGGDSGGGEIWSDSELMFKVEAAEFADFAVGCLTKEEPKMTTAFGKSRLDGMYAKDWEGSRFGIGRSMAPF